MVQNSTTPLDRAIEIFLRNAGDLPLPCAATSAGAFADPFEADPPFTAKVRRPAPSKPDVQGIDPFSSRKQIWKALEDEVEEEERTRMRKTFRHRPETPEELPDLSNL